MIVFIIVDIVVGMLHQQLQIKVVVHKLPLVAVVVAAHLLLLQLLAVSVHEGISDIARNSGQPGVHWLGNPVSL